MNNNWEVKTIGELCNLATGGTPSRNKPEYFEGGEIKWLVSGDIHKKEIYDCEGRITEEGLKNSNARFLPVNSVLIALNGQGKTRGTVALLKTEATCNQSLVSIFPKDTRTILPEYIFCNLHGRYEEIRRITGDDDKDRRGLNMPLIRAMKIPVPPFAEQQRIVAIIDEAIATITKAKENAERNLQNARELFDSYLLSIFANPGDDWEEKTLGEIGSPKMCKRVFKEQTKAEGDIPFYKIGTFGKEPDAFISKEIYDEYRAKYSFPQKGDVLISASGTIGRRVRYDGEPAYFQDSNIVWISNDEKQVLNDYLYEFYGACKWGSTKGATISRLYNDNLKSIKISFPKSKEEQQTIVRQLDALRAETKKLENIYRQKINDLDELKKSILQKAFSGELTAKRQVSNVIEFPVRIPNITTTDLQAGIVATAFQRHHQKGNVLTFGHVKAEKIVHLAQEVLNIELEREPVKDAAGPNDFPRLKKVESRAEKAGFFRTVKHGYGYTYIPGNQFNNLIEKTKTALNDKADELTNLIDLLVPLDTQQAELVATVYAAWNNLLIDNLPITDETVVYEARENWHEAKMKIDRERFFKTINWMKEKNLIPKGKGKKVLPRK